MRAILWVAMACLWMLGCAVDEPAPRCELGRSTACVCSSGASGAQECGPSGVWSPCVCSAPVDAGSDVAVVGDARADAPNAADVPRDADPRCSTQPSATTWCEAGDAGVCVDLQRDPRNCGRCGLECGGVGYECFGGFCFVRPADAGRD
jgi:hypothetical protein